jgi:cytochrome d ubiquinol oxidase subunit I
MWVATFVVVGFAVAAVYAAGLLRGRDDRHHRMGFTVPFAFATVAAIVQPFVGHVLGARLYGDQPTKLAAIELAPHAEDHAPLVIGGVYLDGERRFAIELPQLGSIISRGAPGREVPGIADVPEADRPDDELVTATHWSFQLMVGLGLGLAGLGGAYWWARRRGRDWLGRRWFLRAAVAAGAAAIATLELGWTTTELGRQPWIAYGQMRVVDAVTGVSGLSVWLTFAVLTSVYAALGVAAVLVLRSMARRWREGEPADLPTPYSPEELAR